MGQIIRPVDLTQGAELHAILRFSIPLFIGNVFQQLYNVIDTMVVGRWVDYSAMAAVGLCFPLVITVSAPFLGIGTGVSLAIAKHTGAGDWAGVERVIYTAWKLLLISSIPVTILGLLGAERSLLLISVPKDILANSTKYMQVLFLSSFFILVMELTTESCGEWGTATPP